MEENISDNINRQYLEFRRKNPDKTPRYLLLDLGSLLKIRITEFFLNGKYYSDEDQNEYFMGLKIFTTYSKKEIIEIV